MKDKLRFAEKQHHLTFHRKTWFKIGRIVVSVILLILIFKMVKFRDIVFQISHIDIYLYITAFIFYFLTVVIRSLRWKVMLKPVGINSSVSHLARLYLVGFFWDIFLPTGFGGDAVKAANLSYETGQVERATASVLAERIVGILGTSLIALAVVLFRPSLVPKWVLIVIITLSAGIILFIGLMRLNYLDKINKLFYSLHKITNLPTVRKFDTALKSYTINSIVLGILISMPFTLCLVFVNFLIGSALGLQIHFHYYIIFIPVVTIVNVLPLSFNGVGVREYMYQLLFTVAGTDIGSAVSMALAFNFMKIFAGLTGGLLSLIRVIFSIFSTDKASISQPNICEAKSDMK